MYDGLPTEITVEVAGPIRLVRFNRPEKLNSVNAALHSGLLMVLRQLRADAEARVVILTGNGRAFSAGAEFGWLKELHLNADLRERLMDETSWIMLEMIRLPFPVIAAVNGPAVGLGCNLALLSDVVLIGADAHLADPHVSVGLVAGDGGAALWPLMTSLLRIKEYLYTGDRISPAEAVALGLATRVVPSDKLLDEALHLAERLAKQPARALRDTKRTLNLHLLRAASGAIQAGLTAELLSQGSIEHGERVERLMERRMDARS
jgi:enoyl-CoA hydratase